MSFVIATKTKTKKVIKLTKTLSNSAELHFDNYAISYKELDLSINLKKKKLKTGCTGIPLNCSIVIPICPYYGCLSMMDKVCFKAKKCVGYAFSCKQKKNSIFGKKQL